MHNDIHKLELQRAKPATYAAGEAGYAPPEKYVPFSHFPAAGFCPPRGLPGRLRRAGLTLLITAVLFFLFAPGGRAESLSLERLVAQAQTVYEKTADLQARFVQEVTIKAMQRTEREEGTVSFKHPRMMLWDYDRPKDKKLVINAQTAWLYVPEDRMVYVQSAEAVYRSRTAVKFLSGIGKLAEDFQIRLAKEQPAESYLLILTAKEAGTGIDQLHLALDRKSFQVTQCRFDDAFGNRTNLRFSSIRINTGLAENLFTFKIPPGTEVVNLP
jgi:outer membrane lipoprotein carrier protein